MFQVAHPSSTQQVVQIWDENRAQLFTTTITVPASRSEAADDVIVTFRSTPEGDPPAIKSWFYPGETAGHQFVYPEEQARQIARTSRELVLSGDIDPDHPESAGAEPFALVDEEGRRQPFETRRPPNVVAGSGTGAESGRVQARDGDGEQGVEHHLTQIVRLTDVTLSGESEPQQRASEGAVGTAGSAEVEAVTIPRAHLEQIREHARRAQEKLNDQ